jgi:hypothetical protein
MGGGKNPPRDTYPGVLANGADKDLGNRASTVHERVSADRAGRAVGERGGVRERPRLIYVGERGDRQVNRRV